MNIRNIQITELSSNYAGEIFARATTYSDFIAAKSFIDANNLICFIEDQSIIYAQRHEYRGMSAEQAAQLEKLVVLETTIQNIEKKLEISNDITSIIGSLTYTDDDHNVSGDNVTDFVIKVLNVFKDNLNELSIYISNLEEAFDKYETILQGFDPESEDASNVKDYIDNKVNDLRSDFSEIIKNGKLVIKGDDNHILVTEVPNDEAREFKIEGTDIASAKDLQELQERVTSIFDSESDSLSDIIRKELEEAFVPKDATEGSLNSITKIANWIQNHPSEYTTLYEKVINLQSSWDENLDKFAYKGNLYDINGQLKEIRSGVKFGETVEDINNLIKDMSFAKNVEDGAEQNWVTGINIKDQNINVKGVPVKVKGADGEETENLQVLSADYDGVLRTISFGANTDVIETIADKAVDLSVDMSKTYIDNKLSWKIN